MAQPRKIGDVLAQLIARRGYAREQSAAVLEAAWKEAAGKPLAEVTRAGVVRRGTFEVFVANNLMAQELGFQTDELVRKLEQLAPQEKITKLRFRVGAIN
jgi:predicted nucleic acid-binding Zn ribbon protein